MKEIWKDIEGYEHVYQVSNYGRIKSLRRIVTRPKVMILKERILKLSNSHDGYKMVTLYNIKRSQCRVHRLVAIAFIPNPENKPEINHKKGMRYDNRSSELEWATRSENMRHSYEVLGRRNTFYGKFGKDNIKSRPVIKISMDGNYIEQYYGIADAFRKTNINKGNISECCNGNRKTSGGFKWKFK